MHGGLVATMLDEAMGWVTMSHGIWAVTGKINVRYRDPVPLLQPVTVVGMIEKNRGRWVTVRAEIRSSEGAVLSEADAIFMRVSGERQVELEEIYRGMTLEDVRQAALAGRGCGSRATLNLADQRRLPYHGMRLLGAPAC